LTLCGLLAQPTPRRYDSLEPRACLTCNHVESLRPSGRTLRPADDLAALRAIHDSAAAEFDRTRVRGEAGSSAEQILFDLLAAA
jgi:hypothetical protein